MKQIFSKFLIILALSGTLIFPFCGKEKTVTFDEPFLAQANGGLLYTEELGHAAPCVYDIDMDGKNDLLVGYFGRPDKKDKSVQGGKLLIFKNVGTNQEPEYQNGDYFKINGKLGTVPSG